MLEELSLCSFYKDLSSSHKYDPMCMIQRTDSGAEPKLSIHSLENTNNQSNTNGTKQQEAEKESTWFWYFRISGSIDGVSTSIKVEIIQW